MNQSELISDLQLYDTTDFKGLVDTNHIQSIYQSAPEKMETILSYASGQRQFNTLQMLTQGLGNVRYINSKEYEWDLYMESEKSIPVSEDLNSGNSTTGIGNAEFNIKLEENWFDEGDVLTTDSGLKVRVQYVGTVDSSGTVYRVQMTDPSPDSYIPDEDLEQGAQFSKLYSAYEEYSDRGGTTSFVGPTKLRNHLTTIRKQYNITRNASKKATVVGIPDPNNAGQYVKTWSKAAEFKCLAQWEQEKDYSMLYGDYSKEPLTGRDVLKGKNGRPVTMGAGFRQQISPANRKYYTKLTYTILDDFLLNLSYASSYWGGNQKFVALTGKMGMREFDRAVRQEMKDSGIQVTDKGYFLDGDGQEMVFQGQFITIKFLNGVELTVKEFPPYDDRVHNRKLHPVSNKPVESYRFTIMNFGMYDGTNNIRKVALEDSVNAMWHVSGSTTPYSGVTHSMGTGSASSKDGYDVHLLEESGVQVQDPTSCGELILDVQ